MAELLRFESQTSCFHARHVTQFERLCYVVHIVHFNSHAGIIASPLLYFW